MWNAPCVRVCRHAGALDGTADSVYVDLLTCADLEALRERKESRAEGTAPVSIWKSVLNSESDVESSVET